MIKILQKITKRFILKSLTVEAVQNFLAQAVSVAKQGAISTDTKIDDWIVDFLENIVRDSAKIEALVKKVKEFINVMDGKICFTADSDAKVQYLTACLLTGGEPLEREVELTRSLVELLATVEKEEVKNE